MNRFLIAGLSVCLAPPAYAQARLSISPTRPEPGAIVRLTLRDSAARGAITSIRGTMAGEPLHFVSSGHGVWRAIGGVPVDASGSVTAVATVERAPNVVDTLTARATVPRLRVATSRLNVDTGFTRPLDSATAARVANENARARDVGRRAHETPQLWTRAFLPPRASEITSRFGSGRVFNGQVTSRHLGVDFRGAIGDTVRAANRGVVALVENFFLAGNVVYIDHGAGVVTGYFHLSQPLVAVGDTVARGQAIGLVGQTGRVTGPHLHWAARYGALAVNPLDLLALSR
jgi:murein DD-endopeptidase MepM/ murein hydrolase activator NlpD